MTFPATSEFYTMEKEKTSCPYQARPLAEAVPEGRAGPVVTGRMLCGLPRLWLRTSRTSPGCSVAPAPALGALAMKYWLSGSADIHTSPSRCSSESGIIRLLTTWFFKGRNRNLSPLFHFDLYKIYIFIFIYLWIQQKSRYWKHLTF